MIAATESSKTPTRIKWFKDGIPLDDAIGQERIWMSSDRSKLEVSNLKYVESGKYTCQAENVAGRDEIHYDVIVQKPPNIQGPSQVNAEVQITQQLILTCPFMGDPMPKITWYRHNRPIEFDFDHNYKEQRVSNTSVNIF